MPLWLALIVAGAILMVIGLGLPGIILIIVGVGFLIAEAVGRGRAA